MGFPQGFDILEENVVPSANFGEIRKIEKTIMISAPVGKGTSGSPVITLDKKGNPFVIGIVARRGDEKDNLGICIKSKHLHELFYK